MHEALFFHGGPGMSAGIERLWFGSSLPICWWDQPAVVDGSPSPFKQLVAGAAEQLRSMAESSGKPVALIAHSFGGRIAHELALTTPELISDITLLGSGADSMKCVFRLLHRMNEIEGVPAFQTAMESARRHLDASSFKTMVLAAAAHPAYPAVYFGPGSAAIYDRFISLVPQVQFLDMETFLAVMNDLLTASALRTAREFDGEVTLLLGRHDPVLAQEEDKAEWQRVFPQVQTRQVDCGHFVHLELPPEIWWQGGRG